MSNVNLISARDELIKNSNTKVHIYIYIYTHCVPCLSRQRNTNNFICQISPFIRESAQVFIDQIRPEQVLKIYCSFHRSEHSQF